MKEDGRNENVDKEQRSWQKSNATTVFFFLRRKQLETRRLLPTDLTTKRK